MFLCGTSAEANIAEAVSAVPVASVMSEPATNSRTTKKKKRVKFIGPIGYKTSMALKKANSSRKVKKGKSKSTALVASSWLGILQGPRRASVRPR